MNRGRISTQVFLCFLMMMFLVVSGCGKSDDAPAPSPTYTVTFDSQSATVAASPTSKTVTSPATTVVTLPTPPTKTNYYFAGWWRGTNGTGTEFTATTAVTGNITVYANWSINPVYTVTFDSQGGTAVDARHVTSPATTVVTLPIAPTKTGYIFGGWYTATSGGGSNFIGTTVVTGDITVYAQWDSYDYTVTYNSDGGSAVTAQHVISPETTVVTLPTPPTKASSTFAGWFTAASGGGTQFTATTPVTGAITVYANWTTNPVYTVTYNSDGGSAVGPQYVTFPATTVVTLPADPTKTGYTFGGWYTAISGGGTHFTGSTTVAASLTVYAKWTATSNTYTASGTYTWNSGTSTLTLTWTSSNFTCSGPSLGTETETGVTITSTTMTMGDMTWTRSPAGPAGDARGTWTATSEGNTYTTVISDGTMTLVGVIVSCSDGGSNPGVQTQYWPGNDSSNKYQVTMWYDDSPKTASAVSVTGHGITGSRALTYYTSGGYWNLNVNLGATSPTGLPFTYTFSITDTTTWTATATVSCFQEWFATNLSPTGTVAGTPTFSWTGIGDSSAKYKVELNDSSYNRIWESDKISGTSIVYGGSTALTSGATYNYFVVVTSSSTCSSGRSFASGSFTHQ